MTAIYIGRLVKVFWIFSLLVFLGVLLYVHVSLPPFVSFTSEITTFEFLNFDKSNIFYWTLAVFILSNLAWYLIVKMLANLTKRRTSRSKKFFTDNRISWLINWFNSFSSLINIVIILSLLFINILFSESKGGLDQIITVIYGFLIIICLWFLLLAYLIIRNERPEEVLEA